MKAQPRIAGDHFLIFKYAERFSLRLNFRIIILAERLGRFGIRGVRGVSSVVNSLMIDYDPAVISAPELIAEVQRLDDLGALDRETLRSRMIHMPMVYGDRWTRACAERFQVPPNLELVACHNRLSTAELIRIHSTSTFWVLFIGFAPGEPIFVPIEPEKRITAPKYVTPRTWTPTGAVALGGILNCLYPMEIPGGYQMIGRTPLLVYDPARRNPAFRGEMFLIRPGDRIVFEPIDHDEYLRIEGDLSSYPYRVEEGEWALGLFPEEESPGDVGDP